jgi:hypothetical protein
LVLLFVVVEPFEETADELTDAVFDGLFGDQFDFDELGYELYI